MTTAPRRLRGALAATAVIAVGAASAVVGASFAAPIPATAPPTGEFSVLQPTGYGDAAPDESPDAAADNAAQGTRTVVVDEHGEPRPGSGVEDALRTLADAPDPSLGGWDFPLVGADGDPCAPTDGDDPDGCPDGIRGATFSLVSPDRLFASFQANPAPERTNPYQLAFCPALEVADDALRYGIVTNAPGEIEFRYWPRGQESQARTVHLASTPEQRSDWQAHLAAEEAFEGDWTLVQHCGVLEGLERYVAYDSEIVVHDILDRTFTSPPRSPFGLPDDRTVPPFTVEAIGPNAILASVPHRSDESARFNVQVLDAGDADDCSATDDRLPLVDDSRTAQTVTVSDDYLAEQGYLPSYTERTSIGVYVPSGSTVLVCAGLFRDNRPGWEWHEAQYRYSMVIQTPNTPRPIVTVTDVDLDPAYRAATTQVFAQWNGTGDHVRCGLWSHSTPRVCGDDPHDITRGDLWVTTIASFGETRPGELGTSSSVVLPLGSLECAGSRCATPETVWYEAPVKLQEHPGEQCGTGMVGPCPATVIGTAHIRVDWTMPTRGGADWVFEPAQSGRVEHELDPLPQMDFLATPTFPESPDLRSAIVQFPLRVDRPVDYTARLLGECERPNAQFEVSGHVAASVTVAFTGACRGEPYRVEVTLTDATGATSVFGGPDGAAWPDSWIVVPGLTYNVVLGQRLALPESVDQVKVRQFRVTVDDQRIEPTLPPNDCIYGNSFHTTPSAVLESARIGEIVTVDVTVQLAEAWGGIDGSRSRAFCDAGYDSTAPVYHLQHDVTLDELFAGVTISAPDDAPYLVDVTLRLGRPTGR